MRTPRLYTMYRRFLDGANCTRGATVVGSGTTGVYAIILLQRLSAARFAFCFFFIFFFIVCPVPPPFLQSISCRGTVVVPCVLCCVRRRRGVDWVGDVSPVAVSAVRKARRNMATARLDQRRSGRGRLARARSIGNTGAYTRAIVGARRRACAPTTSADESFPSFLRPLTSPSFTVYPQPSIRPRHEFPSLLPPRYTSRPPPIRVCMSFYSLSTPPLPTPPFAPFLSLYSTIRDVSLSRSYHAIIGF